MSDEIAVRVRALLDRLLYHATVITIEGPSYRLAQHKRRQQDRAEQRAEATADVVA